MRPWTVLCDDAELAVEIARGAAALGLPVDPRPSANLVAELARAEGAVALAYVLPPGDEELVALAAAARAERPPLALLVAEAGTLALARELGFPAVLEVEPFLALMALGEPPEGGFAVPLRPLSPADRRRLTAAGARGEARPGEARLEPGDGSRLQRVGSGATQPVGSARDVAEALVALRDRERAPRPALPRVEGVDRGATRDVLLGPRRALSDPTSKAALAPYDVPFPAEELCASASRAAAEATRLGFPVRVALASPALRGWDHPELVEARVESAARVRDVYRQLHALAAARAPDAPLLGVTVSAAAQARALLRVDARRVGAVVLADLGFADAHGRAARDRARLVLPTSPGSFERALRLQLRGASLLLAGPATQRRATVRALGDALLRLAAFLGDFPDEVERVIVDPLAVLVGGTVELREVSVQVSDSFERALAAG